MVTGAGRHKKQVPEGGKFYKHGPSEFVIFCVSDNKLSAMAQMNRGITTLYKKLIWAAHCTYWARAQNMHLFFLSSLQAKPMDVHGSNFVGRKLHLVGM